MRKIRFRSSFNGICSRDNLPKKIKDGAYVIKLDEYGDNGTHWIPLFCTEIEVIYFAIFGFEHVPKEIERFIEQKKHKNKHN